MTANLGFAGYSYEIGDRHKVVLLRTYTKIKLIYRFRPA